MAEKKSKDYTPPAQVPGRNDPCHCGSGKKYKKCHEDIDATAQHAVLEKQWTAAEKIAAQKAEEENKTAPEHNTAPTTKPAHQTHVSDHRRNTMTVPKFNMPRKTGGGGA